MATETIQHSPQRKQEWLADAMRRAPVGALVQVVASDVPEYIGATGRVVNYDLGGDGAWPIVGVEFDRPIGGVAGDGFYCDGAGDDEIKVMP